MKSLISNSYFICPPETTETPSDIFNYVDFYLYFHICLNCQRPGGLSLSDRLKAKASFYTGGNCDEDADENMMPSASLQRGLIKVNQKMAFFGSEVWKPEK